MGDEFDVFAPISTCWGEIVIGLLHLPTFVPYEEFRAHVERAARKFEKLEEYTPTYWNANFTVGTQRSSRLNGPMAHTLKQMLYELEFAGACCVFAKALTPKPLRTYLLRAMFHCAQFDAIRAKSATACKKGGCRRDAKNNPVRIRTARLLYVLAPVGGWRDVSEAARAVEKRLADFIQQRRRFSMGWGDSLRRTIRHWIRTHPLVRPAFMATSAPNQ